MEELKFKMADKDRSWELMEREGGHRQERMEGRQMWDPTRMIPDGILSCKSSFLFSIHPLLLVRLSSVLPLRSWFCRFKSLSASVRLWGSMFSYFPTDMFFSLSLFLCFSIQYSFLS